MIKLLSNGLTNAKTSKLSNGRNFILYMAPHKVNGLGVNLCPKASEGCAAACLSSAGRGRFENVKAARLFKARFFIERRDDFLTLLHDELSKLKAGDVVRLNGTTDICWERYNIPQSYPHLTFYDYTKILGRRVPINYHLTFSRAENNDPDVLKALDQGLNVAIVFKGARPETFLGRPVINGDEHDFRYLDPKGVIVGLSAKGAAKRDCTGFAL